MAKTELELDGAINWIVFFLFGWRCAGVVDNCERACVRAKRRGMTWHERRFLGGFWLSMVD